MLILVKTGEIGEFHNLLPKYQKILEVEQDILFFTNFFN